VIRSKRLPRMSVALAAVVLLATGVVEASPAMAGQSDVFYGMTTTSRPIEFYEHIPAEITQGSPSTLVFLENPGSPFCEDLAGIYDLGLIIDDYLSFGIPQYANPTRMHAANPPGSRPEKAEFSTFPGGPHAVAQCQTPESGLATATWGGAVNPQLTIESATSNSTSVRVPGEDAVVTEALATLHGVKLGDSTIRNFESWLKVEWRPAQQPVISYRLVVQGLANGTSEVASSGGKGIVLAGQNVAGSDFAKQFNEQSKAHETALQQIGTYGFHFLEPRYFKDEVQRRDAVEMPVLDASWGFSARKGGIGEAQGIRLGLTRMTGRIVPRPN